MSRAGSALHAVWQFVVGDDWRVAVGVAATISLTALAAAAGVAAWWILPLGVVAMLAGSLRRAARR